MTGIEIFLILIGITAIICSFVFSKTLDKLQSTPDNTTQVINEKEIEKKINEKIDSFIDEKMESTQVEIERIMNEKIMTVAEYSDNVISDIDKNHDEVMFLYGMLNDKEKDVKNILIDIENIKKSVKDSVKSMNVNDISNEEQDIEVKSVPQKNENVLTENEKTDETDRLDETDKSNDTEKSDESSKFDDALKDNNISKNSIKKENPQMNDDSVTKGNKEIKRGAALTAREAKKRTNNNNRILELHKMGEAPLDIAKELGIGIGEVRLVIDLYRNR